MNIYEWFLQYIFMQSSSLKKSHPAITQTPLFAQSIIYLPRQCMLKQDKINYMENERDIISIAFWNLIPQK